MIDPHPIDCLECQSQLAEFALDELPELLRAPIVAHLESGCAACNEKLAEILSGYAKLVYALPMQQPAPQIERALLTRIGGHHRESAGLSIIDSRVDSVSRKRAMRRLLASAIALAAGILGIALWSNWHGQTAAPAGPEEWAAVQRRVERANVAGRISAIPQLKFASLRRPSADIIGYIVIDELAKQWHVYAFHLPSPAPGRRYHLWIDLGNSQFRHAGVAEIDGDGTLAQVVNVPADVADARGLAISDESEEAPNHPTGDNLVEAPLP